MPLFLYMGLIAFMRLLLVAPAGSGAEIDQIPEIREISRMHRTTVLSGPVSLSDLEQAAREEEYEGIHFATHLTNPGHWDQLLLSDGQVLTLSDTSGIARMAAAKFVFFNTCNSARFAAYLVAHGVAAAIYTTIELWDSEAWRMPLRFYQQLHRQEMEGNPPSLAAAFDLAHPNDGIYGFVTSSPYTTELAQEVREISGELKKLSSAVTHNREVIERPSQFASDPWVRILLICMLVLLAVLVVMHG